MSIKRRDFLKKVGYAAAGSVLSMPLLASNTYKTAPRVVIIGGGFAGCTAAKYIRMWAPDFEVIMVERQQMFVSCPQSNLILSHSRTLQDLSHGYDELGNTHGVKVIHAEVVAIDTEKQRVKLHDDVQLDYDRLIVAPGLDLDYTRLPMLASLDAQQRVPHAWKAGSQSILLRDQLTDMRQGGLMVMTIPTAPYRCPPGPYERACQVALYLKRHNPRGKLVILDANADIVSKKSLFVEAWRELYPGLIDYQPMSPLESVDVDRLTVDSAFDSFTADVLNVIPPQKAGKIAQLAGVVDVDGRWCRVDYRSYESLTVPQVHVIGDAVSAGVPKSAHIANSQAKVCAAAIIALIRGEAPEQQPVFSNTCYSFVDDHQAGHVAAVYRYDAEQADMLPMPGGGVSATASAIEGDYAVAWAENIWADMLN